jgi:Spy/CpxP family protein refolding chaperone
MKKLMCGFAAFAAGALLMGSPAMSQPPGGKDDKGGFPGGKGGFPGGKGGFKLGVVLPPFAQEQLKLTDDQKAKLGEIEADVKAKLEKMLTPDQLKSLETLRPGGPGGAGGPGGKGGFPGGKGGKGGPGDKGGPGGGKGERAPF